ncbi:MAG TPA: hypothetical protein VJZ70_05255 [Limnochordia bacterium]|nr:hypothetical protein [Limnochordia bacterium]
MNLAGGIATTSPDIYSCRDELIKPSIMNIDRLSYPDRLYHHQISGKC